MDATGTTMRQRMRAAALFTLMVLVHIAGTTADARSPALKIQNQMPLPKWPLHDTQAADTRQYPYSLGWFAPFWSGTGYSSEALNFVLSMIRAGAVQPSNVWIAHHGDQDRKEVREAMEDYDKRQLTQLEHNANRSHPSIIVCHSLPTNWMMPSQMSWTGNQCPPDPREYAYVYTIGRTMFETDRLPASFVPRCNNMNEIWVPSEFSKEVFIRSGVVASKLRVVPEGVNTTHMDPMRHDPMPLPQGELVFGPAHDGYGPDISPHGTEDVQPHPTNNIPSLRVKRDDAVGAAEEIRDVAGASEYDSTVDDSSHTSRTDSNPIGSTVTQSNVPERLKADSATFASSSSPPPSPPQTTQAQDGLEGSGQVEQVQKPVSSIEGGPSSHESPPQLLGQLLEPLKAAAPPRRPTCKGSGSRRCDEDSAPAEHAFPAPPTSQQPVPPTSQAASRPFRFLSTFKWEPRKGWDVLLEAYLSEFTDKDSVELFIITKPFVGGSNYKQQMHAWAERSARARWQQVQEQHIQQQQKENTTAKQLPTEPFTFNATLLPRLYVVHRHISDADLPRFYKAVDAFVLPSRGEGWGRPHVEAMSMGLPVIATNWSGITAYLDDAVGYPLAIDGLVPADPAVWWFRGLNWAQPSVSHLRMLMRRVYEQRDEARRKGAAARQRMIEQYGPQAIGKLMAAEFERVNDLIPR